MQHDLFSNKFSSARAFLKKNTFLLEINLRKLRFCPIERDHLFVTTIDAVIPFGVYVVSEFCKSVLILTMIFLQCHKSTFVSEI